nr:MAG TPA: hypothetical protein [Caudoviricetes sp.]
MCCGKIYDVRKGNFSKTKSQWYMGNDGYLPWCNECREKMFEFYVKKYNDEDEAIDRLAMMFDTYVNDKLLDASEHSVASALKINTYMGRLNIRQYADKSYDDVIDQKKKDALAAGDTKGTKVTQKMIRFWGDGFDERDYLFLEDHYQNWITRQECKTVSQETLFKQIAKAELNSEKAYATGDTKKIKEATDNLLNLMTSANVKPNQTNDNALAESNTFGTLIQKWEEEEPIPEPAPEWQDVDGIGKYFRVWVLGTLLKMFNLPNPYQEEFDKEMERYTAHKPSTTEDDSADGSLRETIFGPSEGGGSS